MSEKEHILTDEEREFLSSFSYCGSDQVTLDDWVKSFGGGIMPALIVAYITF